MKTIAFAAACLLAASVPALADPPRDPSTADDIDVRDLVDLVAKSTGRQFVIDPRVRAQVPLAGIDPARVSFEQLQAILDVHQLVVVNAGDLLAVVADANARQLPVPVHTEPTFQAFDYEIVTLLLQPKQVCAAYLVPVLRPLMPQAAHLAADLQTNSLLVNDRAANVRRIARLVAEIDQRGAGRRECPSPSGAIKGGGKAGS